MSPSPSTPQLLFSLSAILRSNHPFRRGPGKLPNGSIFFRGGGFLGGPTRHFMHHYHWLCLYSGRSLYRRLHYPMPTWNHRPRYLLVRWKGYVVLPMNQTNATPENSTCSIDELGTKRWSLNGQIHRTDGPALEYASGTKGWFQFGVLHREDGAAIEYRDNSKLWYWRGKFIKCSSQSEFERLLKLKAFW